MNYAKSWSVAGSSNDAIGFTNRPNSFKAISVSGFFLGVKLSLRVRLTTTQPSVR
jgi:hypothetical protein